MDKLSVAKKLFGFRTGTGKDAKVFIKIAVKENGEKKIYNVPLLTLTSIQAFVSRPKVARRVMGTPNPIGLSKGIRTISGMMTSNVLNESLATKIKKLLKSYQPIEARNLSLDEENIITLEDTESLQYMDQLPPCDINVFITNPNTGKVFSKSIKGVVFKQNESATGSGPTIGESFSFVATDISPLKLEDISHENE